MNTYPKLRGENTTAIQPVRTANRGVLGDHPLPAGVALRSAQSADPTDYEGVSLGVMNMSSLME